jgi:hypothetical protein
MKRTCTRQIDIVFGGAAKAELVASSQTESAPTALSHALWVRLRVST